MIRLKLRVDATTPTRTGMAAPSASLQWVTLASCHNLAFSPVTKPSSQFSGNTLRDILSRTSQDVKVFRLAEKSHTKLPAAQVLRMLGSMDFVGGGNPNRVRYVREVSRLPFVACWRTTEAATLWTMNA